MVVGAELYIPVGMGRFSVNRGLEFVPHQYVQSDVRSNYSRKGMQTMLQMIALRREPL